MLACVNALNRYQPNYRNPFWKNVRFFSNFYFSIKAAKNFKIKNNYYVGLTANAIYFENYSQYEIDTEKDSYYLKSNYYLNNKLLFLGINLRKNWDLNKKNFTGFTLFSINSNVYSNTIYNGSTYEYLSGKLYGYYPYPISGFPLFQRNGWLTNKTLKTNIMYDLLFGLKSKFNKTPICFSLGTSYYWQFSEILMSKYSLKLGVTIDL